MDLNITSRRQLLMIATSGVCLAMMPAMSWGSNAKPRLTSDLKVYAFIAKKKDLSDSEFHAHWRGPHARLTENVPQINRYLQNHGIGAVPTVPGLQATPYLGIATIWVANLDKLNAIYGDPGFIEVHADELNLLERDQLKWLITREAVVAPGPKADDILDIPTKSLLFLKRSADMSKAAFREGVARTATSLPQSFTGARVTYALPDEAAYPEDVAPPFDSVVEISFSSDADFDSEWKNSAAAVLSRLGKWADIASSRGFLAHEERVIWPPLDNR